MKRTKNLSGLAKISSVFLLAIVISLVAVSFVPTSSGQSNEGGYIITSHNTSVTISPNISNCGDLPTNYKLSIFNDGPDNIREVRIYEDIDGDGITDPGIVSFECGPVPNSNWTLDDRRDPYQYCQYETTVNNPAMINPGESLDFTFNAVLDDTNLQCGNQFKVATIDDKIPEGEVRYKFPLIQVDCSDPQLEKTVSDPKVLIDPGCNSDTTTCDYWVDRDTSIEFWASDTTEADECNLGLDYCEWRITLDGVPGEWQTEVNGPELHWNLPEFEEDSNHLIEARCFDIAGNMFELVELDKVDGTSPNTDKYFAGPQYCVDSENNVVECISENQQEDGIVEWIDSVTTVHLTAVDPEAEYAIGQACNIGVDKTWYRNDWYNDEHLGSTGCYEPANFCNTGFYDEFFGLEFPYPEHAGCIDSMQTSCTEKDGFAYGTPEWYECVDFWAHEECRIDDAWHLYVPGNAIDKEEESCHVLTYFSVDHLGNVEEPNMNCFFVDKTPPVLTKDHIGPIMDDEDGELGVFHWITQETDIVLSCEDANPHPTPMVTLHWRTWDDISGVWSDWMTSSGDQVQETIEFSEDSVHKLEYYCVDAVEKTTETHLQTYRVDSTPPVIEKTMFGHYLGDCPLGADNLEHGDCYVADNGESGVTVTAYDPDPTTNSCNVGVNYCEYHVWWNTGEEECRLAEGLDYESGWCLIDQDKFVDTVDVIFTEDSTHTLYVYCEDMLGNEMPTHVEDFLVDSTPPVTWKSFGEPYYSCYDWCWEAYGDDGPLVPGVIDGGSMEACLEEYCSYDEWNDEYYPQWITSNTPVTLESEDNKVGVDTIYWRNMVIENPEGWGACESVRACHPDFYGEFVDGDTLFNEYDGEFFKAEESCHVIEYYAVDLLGNKENVNWQCVFVDNSAPEGTKEVGDPSIFIGEGGDVVTPPGSGSVDPAMVDVDLEPGESVVIEKEITTGPIAAAAPEIYFLADTTGSMNSVISQVKTNMNTILDSIEAKFGAGDYKDFPTDSYQFNNRQSITTDESLVEAAINAMSASGGNDGSEGQFYALQHIAENDVGFSGDSTKIVVWFGDAPGHDSICSAISGEADITEASLITELQNAGITVIAISTKTGYVNGLDDDPTSDASDYSGTCTIAGTSGQATRIAAATGGIHLTNVDAVDITNAIIDAIGEVTGTTTVVPDASECTDIGLLVTFDPETHTDVGGSETVTFMETITVPAEAEPGEYTCNVYFRSGELGGIIATETIWVNGEPTGSGSGIDWFVTTQTPIHLSCDDPEPHPVDYETVKYRFSYHPDGYGGPVEYSIWYSTDKEVTVYFEQDSWHNLEYYCVDALGNTNMVDHENFVVETVPPNTVKIYEGPYFEKEVCEDGLLEASTITPNGVVGEGCHIQEYIDTASTIKFVAEDPQPHPSGVDETYYRITLVGDLACESQEEFCTPAERNDYEIAGKLDWSEEDNTPYWDEYPYGGETVDPSTIGADIAKGFDGHRMYEFALPLTELGSMEGDKIKLGIYTLDGKHKAIQRIANHNPSTNQPSFPWEDTTNWPEYTLTNDGTPITVDGNTGEWDGSTLLFTECDAYDQKAGASITHCFDFYATVYDGNLYVGVDYTDDTTNDDGDNTDGAKLMVAVSTWKTYSEPFGIPEESCHLVEFYSVDKLTTTEDLNWQCVFVDKHPPVTEKKYGEPFFEEEGYHWITTATPISLLAEDQEPHPSGVDRLYWRTTQVDVPDVECTAVCEFEGSGEWNMVEDDYATFSVPEESCHVIEYYAVDKVNKTEQVNRQCVFVDDTPPEPIKTVGEPKEPWNGLDANFYDLEEFCTTPGNCWKVTTMTPITLDCSDPEPHPVDHEKVWFKVELDGDDYTQKYCENINGEYNEETGYCLVLDTEAPVEFYFTEISEHNLKYYCEDALGNVGPVDDEKFKVEDGAFEIQLNKKWNLISTPFVLLDDSIGQIFDSHAEEVEAVWTYDAVTGEWYIYTPDGVENDNLDTMVPGWGYWVLAQDNTELVIGGSLLSPINLPPSKPIANGWNLIGYYGNMDGVPYGDRIFEYVGPVGDGAPATCMLGTLVDTTVGYPKWSSLFTYWELDNPDLWKFLGFHDNMDPGAGYWVNVDLDPAEEESYDFSTTCPGIFV